VVGDGRPVKESSGEVAISTKSANVHRCVDLSVMGCGSDEVSSLAGAVEMITLMLLPSSAIFCPKAIGN
jgi:hypothetical protein